MQTIPGSVAASSSRPTTPGAVDEDLPRRYKKEAIESHRRMLRDSIISMKGVIAKLEKSLKKELWREVQVDNDRFSERDGDKRIDIPEWLRNDFERIIELQELEERVDWREAYHSVWELDEKVAQLHEYRETDLWFEESEGGYVQPPPFYDTGRPGYSAPKDAK